MNWTQADEALYQEHRRMRAVGKVREAFDRIDLSDGTSDFALEEILRNADAIRDALEPFDSGIRVQEVAG